MTPHSKSWVAAYQGIDGAFSQEAIFSYFNKQVPTCGLPTFDDVIEQVEAGEAQYGFLPAENSITGTIVQTYDLLLQSNLCIIGEYYLPIHHNLMILPDSNLESIQRVFSHPQALAQCAQYLKRLNTRTEVVWDTAGSAQKIRQENLADAAAIASHQAAKAYQLKIVAANIEDIVHNTTRFFVLSKQSAKAASHNKTSILFSVKHQPGSLVDCLQVFSAQGLNLSKIESRPDRQHPWHYIFYLDFEGHIDDPIVNQVLLHLLKRATMVKILGSYPLGDKPNAA